MQNQIDNRQLRSFGVLVGGVFALIAFWPALVYRADPRWWALSAAAILLIPAAVYPSALRRPHQAWMSLGHLLGWVNTRIILGLIFYAVVTPIGLLRGLLGKDPMGKKLEPGAASYRIPRAPRSSSHLRRQY
jgi:hypothetical protein